MLEQYFIKPDTVDRIRESWIGEPIQRYVAWLNENSYSSRTVTRRVPILMCFGEFAHNRGARTWEELPELIESFAENWVRKHGKGCTTKRALKRVANEARNPVNQMLRLILPGYSMTVNRSSKSFPFRDLAPGFFTYLQEEKGLQISSIKRYQYELRFFEAYLKKINLQQFNGLSPAVLSAFITESSQSLSHSTIRGICSSLHVFLRYLYREHFTERDLSSAIEHPAQYRLSNIPRSISWEEVRQMLEVVDRRIPVGKRDYAILLLLITYGLRAREVAALTVDNIDWKRERLLIPERKAGHCTAYPLSNIVGNAIVEYLQKARPQTDDRHLFFRVLAPKRPLTESAISSRASYYLRKAGIPVSRPGSHTLRHTCVQHLVDAHFPLKNIGDYVGHRSPSSTEIYTKVDIEALREVALGDGEEIL
jgi:site-specific recombinase XerD